jgi:hypothetical protein
MIIGHGDLASVLKDREDRIYFASGVSNSQEDRESEYQREIDLLMNQDTLRHIVYFSSLSIFYTDTRYTQHKLYMESLIKNNFDHYTIVRLGNITFGKNPHTIINFFKNKIKNHEKIEIQDTYRYIVDKDEFLYWINFIPEWNCEMSIIGRRMKVSNILEEIKQGKL